VRVWQRAEQQELSRVLFVNMLDRERADFFRVLEAARQQLSDRCVAIQLPIGSEHELTGVVDLLHMCAYMDPSGGREGGPQPIPDSMTDLVQKHREKLLDAVVETDEELMGRYLEGEELEAEAGGRRPQAGGDPGRALSGRVRRRVEEPRHDGAPRPARRGRPVAGEEGDDDRVRRRKAGRLRLQDDRRPVHRAHQLLPGSRRPRHGRHDARRPPHAREGAVRPGALLQGKDSETVDALGIGDLGAVAKLKDVVTGDVLVDHEVAVEPPHIDFPEPVLSFAVTPKAKGDEEKMATGLRRLHEEDPTLIMRRDPQTGEQLLSGLSQMQVEVAVDRLSTRFHVDVELHPPRVPYKETIRKEARARHRYKKQTGGRGQFGDCAIVLEPLPAEDGELGYEFVDKIVGGVISQSYRPAVDKGIREAMEHGELAGAPVQGVRVLLVDGMEHNVDSSEMAFKIAGSMAFKEAYQQADPVLLEPIMELEVAVPDDAVGAVNGDLNSRRGRLQGMEPAGGMTTIKAEVPMAEILTYSQALTSMTGGRGDYSMHFLRYEEVPTHVAQKIIEQTKREREEAKI
jgi:elongation factor G